MKLYILFDPLGGAHKSNVVQLSASLGIPARAPSLGPLLSYPCLGGVQSIAPIGISCGIQSANNGSR